MARARLAVPLTPGQSGQARAEPGQFKKFWKWPAATSETGYTP